MPDRSGNSPPDFRSPFTGEGHDLQALTSTGLDIRPVPLSAGVFPAGRPWRFERVFSPFCRLYHARHEDMVVETSRKTWRVPRNGFLLLPAEVHFRCYTDDSAEHLWIHFRLLPAFLPAFAEPIPVPGNGLTRSLQAGVRKEIRRRESLHRIVHRAKALLHALLGELDLVDEAPVPHKLQKTLGIVHDHLEEPLSVRELARKAGYSPEYLAHLFRLHLGTSPAAFLRNARLREAARRLAYTDLTIEAIADDLCFANRHHFSRLFSSKMGEPPARFRKRVQRSAPIG